jgi:ferredoxin-NADP reductase
MGATAARSSELVVKLKSQKEIADYTMAFRFEKPVNWTFKAGQSLDMTLLDPPEMDAEGNKRAFSIASAPHEDTLMIATRMRDTAFKRTLKSIPLGSGVQIEGPFGDLKLHNNTSKAAVMLAGGIGITPFHSMVVRAAKEKLPHHIFLFFSNRRPEDAPFLKELQALESQNPNFKLIACMTQMEDSRQRWDGEQGKIDRQMLERHLSGFPFAIYYVTGPPGFVAGMRTTLADSGIDDDDVRTEEFAGY